MKKGLLALILFLFSSVIVASETFGDTINDSVITVKVRTGFVINPITQDQHITVETNDGVVTLKGIADSETQAKAAIEIAAETDGVKKVIANQLFVADSRQPFTDAYITTKVKLAFLFHDLTFSSPWISLWDVKVETQNGVVYLSGLVKNAQQKEEAIALAKSVDDVAEVRNDLAAKC